VDADVDALTELQAQHCSVYNVGSARSQSLGDKQKPVPLLEGLVSSALRRLPVNNGFLFNQSRLFNKW